MNSHDKLLIGFDLKKDPDAIFQAYNDPHGYTKEFNMNLLRRINRELGGNFNVDNFKHTPVYNQEEGIAYSYLESLCNQEVYIEFIGKSFSFYKGERIHTEISRKYDLQIINKIASETGLAIKNTFYDSRQYFVDVLFEKV